MKAVIAEQFRLATLPVRRCADLRSATSGIREASNSGRQLRRAGVRFPASLLGGELVGLMGTRFRERMPQASGSAEEAAYVRETRRVFAPATAADRGRPWSEQAEGARLGPRLAAVSAKTRAGDSVSVREAAGQRKSQSTAWPERADVVQGSSTWDTLQGETEAASSWPGPPSASNKPRVAEPLSAIARQLREYWKAQPPAAAPAVPASEAATPENSRMPETPSALRQSPVQALRPGQGSFAERLQSFVTGRGAPTEHHPRAAWQENTEPAAAARPLHQEASSARPALAGDFADRLSETLFSQAIQHGIDLT